MSNAHRRTALLLLVGVVAILFLLTLCLQADFGVSVLEWTDHLISKPQAFGVFHLISLGICIVCAIFSGLVGATRGSRSVDRIIFGCGLVFLLLEFYKQVYSYFVLTDRVFDFGFFPFQFCSLPLYLCLLVPFLPTGRIKDTLYKFLALYGTMGGCLVMGYPAFYDRAALCIHTMLWHTIMISMGIYLLFACGYGRSWTREVLPASIPFLVSVCIATSLNVLLADIAQKSPNPLNLYYMSPYKPTHFLVVRDVQRMFGWWASIITYIILFIFVGATLVFFAAKLLRLLSRIWCKRGRFQKKL